MSLGKKKIQMQGAAGVVNTDNFAPVIYTGNRLARSISTGFAPDFVWIKNRPQGDPHMLFDSVRGATKFLFSNDTDAEGTSATSLTSFNADSFSLGAYDGRTNELVTYVAWCFKGGGAAVSNTDGSITSQVSANPDAGFSIVSYTGNLTASTVGTGLSSAAELIIVKRTDSTSNWFVYSQPTGNTKYLNLDTTGAAATFNVWNNTSPTSSVFSLAAQGDVNASGGSYIAYCFTSITGYQKVGSYTGNGSASGPTVTTGFRPRFLMTKRTDGSSGWYIADSVRNTTNPRRTLLRPDDNNAEFDGTGTSYFNFNDNSFQVTTTTTQINANGGTYIYLAIA